MAKLKVFIFIIVFIIANKAISQSIDTVTINIDFPFGNNEAHCTALKAIGTEITEFTTVELDNYSFKWTGVSVPELDSTSTAIYSYNTDGSYTIGLTVVEKATSKSISADTTVVIITPTELIVPNVFTPNDDGVNDLFKVFYDGDTELEITIFSRTGTEVFKLKSPTIVWDGRNSSGLKASQGIYYYVLTSEISNINAKGFLYLYDNDPTK
ncbi:MAG: gliding motility-associated C-terminal domain-containing protein [Bacteroidales bacterium]|jgi:gliding motility-associated-like protein|nr:gliding motility-associated C-terminal domain-containing protein [Bacteroidales bacterium]